LTEGVTDVQRMARLGFDEVQAEHLNAGTWRKILLDEERVAGARSCMGYSNFSPGTVTSPIAHEVEEFAFVVTGAGEMRGDEEVVSFRAFDTLYIPAGSWHSIANTGDSDVVMVFGFPSPRYPATHSRAPATT
jgi:mannose-6-phosphate isomerase-like protein (cupin superfamily)